MVFPQYRLGTVFKDLSIARLYMNYIYGIGWLGMSDFVAFQCNFALSRMWIDGAIKIICLKSVKLLSFAVNSDQNSGTDPNLEATVQYCSCKMYLIGGVHLFLLNANLKKATWRETEWVLWKVWTNFYCCFEGKINSFCWHFVSKLFSMDNRTTIIHMAGRVGSFAEIQGSSWKSFKCGCKKVPPSPLPFLPSPGKLERHSNPPNGMAVVPFRCT